MKSIKEIAENGIERDIYIHRIIGIERFLQLIHEKALTLMAPEKWQDPYEKALQAHHEQIGTGSGTEKVYGLCWSSEGRSDALWQIYSPNKLGIKITSSVSRLVKALGSNANTFSQVYCGQVTYLPERTNKKEAYKWPEGGLRLSAKDFSSQISTFANAIDEIVAYRSTNQVLDNPKKARTFLIKRRAFRHEEEVRLLCFSDAELRNRYQNARDKDNKVIKLPISLEDLITQVELDPRMGDDVADSLKALILPKLAHLSISQFKKSTLYSIPKSKGLPQ